MKNTLILLLIAVGLSSCNKTDDTVEAQDIIGTWDLIEVSVNGTDWEDLNEGSVPSQIMGFFENQSYYRTYVGGTWDLDGKELNLNPNGISQYTYEVIEVSSEYLRIRTRISEELYLWDIDQYESDEILLIEELLRRIE